MICQRALKVILCELCCFLLYFFCERQDDESQVILLHLVLNFFFQNIKKKHLRFTIDRSINFFKLFLVESFFFLYFKSESIFLK